MPKMSPPHISGTLRKFALRVPEVIKECSGIIVFGKKIQSLVFTTDLYYKKCQCGCRYSCISFYSSAYNYSGGYACG